MKNSECVTVFYDGSCPSCIRDRKRYETLAGAEAAEVSWVDITGRDQELRSLGIEPQKALRELHVRDSRGDIHRELDAYILLMRKTRWLKPIAFVIGLPLLRTLLAGIYHFSVDRRLRKSGRL